MRKTTNGFTIVELLIVIVVIAILAAITIVAYNGIQTRAENTKTIQATAQYVKAMQSYAALYNTYPVEAAYPCLAEIGTRCGRSNAGAACVGVGQTAVSNTSYMNELAKVMTSIPKFSSITSACGDGMFHGIWTTPTTGKTAEINYMQIGDQQCTRIGGITNISRFQQDNTTRCMMQLPTLP